MVCGLCYRWPPNHYVDCPKGNAMDNKPTAPICVHGRPGGYACPWCLGINDPVVNPNAEPPVVNIQEKRPTPAQMRNVREAFCMATIGVSRPRNRAERRKVLHAMLRSKGKR